MKLFSIRMLLGVAAAPPGSFCRKMSKTSQLRKRLLRIVRPSAAHTCRHSTCELDPALSVKSWNVIPSITTFRGDAVVELPFEAMMLLASSEGPVSPPMNEMSSGDCAPLDMTVKVARSASRTVRSSAAPSTQSRLWNARPRSSRCLAVTWISLDRDTLAPAAGLTITSVGEVFEASGGTLASA